MGKLFRLFGIIFLLTMILASCDQRFLSGKIQKAGLLLSHSIHDQVWGTQGYNGLLKIQSRFDVDVYYKEGMQTYSHVERAVREFDQKGVNLIFGHGSEFAHYFNVIAKEYPHIHFVSFNGDATEKNTTSLNFAGYAMGFFGGMVAAHHTKTKQVGVIAAYEWQPEVEGFFDGAAYENKEVRVNIQYVANWDDREKALEIVEKMLKANVDVFYPAGDGYNVPVIERIKEEGLFAIGYISDQSDLGETTVLTSTVQHVDDLYELVAEKFNKGELESGNLTFDFQDNVISLGDFSPLIDEEYQEKIGKLIAEYKRSGTLPR